MQGTQYATKRSILCRGAFCGPTMHVNIVQPLAYIAAFFDGRGFAEREFVRPFAVSENAHTS